MRSTTTTTTAKASIARSGPCVIVSSLGCGYVNDGGDTVLMLRKTSSPTSISIQRNEADIESKQFPNHSNQIERASDVVEPGNNSPKTVLWSEDDVNATCQLWDLSMMERSNLVELGRRLHNVIHYKNHPSEVVRFMKARPHSISSAEDMFRKSIEWRITHNVDTILKDYSPPKELLLYHPGAILQHLDKEGDPVFLNRSGVTDFAGMLRRFGRQEMIQHAIWLREMACTGEWIQNYEREYGRPVKRIVIIEDIVKLPLLQLVGNVALISLYGEIIRLDQDNYPETSKHVIVIRAPALLPMLWKIVCHFFDPYVRQKMIFCNCTNYQQILSQYIDLSILPACVLPGIGKGHAIEGMPPNFEGGPLPPLESS